MSASKLKTVFLPGGGQGPADGKNSGTAALDPKAEFLLGFFENGAGPYSLPFIEKMEVQLSAADLRGLAAALGEAGFYGESINLSAGYMDREDYEMEKADLELLYPRRFQDLIEQYAVETGMGGGDSNSAGNGAGREILFGLVRTESYFRPGVISRSGAVGLTQLIDSTALEMAGRLARRGGPDYRRENGIDLTDPEANIHLGAVYLEYLIDRMGSPMTALLAYNGGMGRVRRWRTEQAGLPEDLFLETIEYAETREYGRRVLSTAAIYGWLYYGTSMEAVVEKVYR
jgi:soluble lytic murein transglycosylase